MEGVRKGVSVSITTCMHTHHSNMQNITNETITRNTTSSRIASTSPSPSVCVFIHWYARTDEITAMPSKLFPSYVLIQLLGKEEETLNIQRYCETLY